MNVNARMNYPYSDKAEKSRPGKIWKGIPGFEGYMASSHGRVRSVDREVSHRRCGKQFVKGRILSQNIKKHYNHFKDDYIVILQVTLMQEGIRYEDPVRRLVYAAFTDAGILKMNKKMVISKDNDGFNNRLENVMAVDKSERMKRLFQQHRVSSVLAEMDHAKFKPTFNLWRPVHKCDLKGRILKTYPCIAHAAKKEGFYEKGITGVAKGRHKTYKGFKWKYASIKILERLRKKWHAMK